MTKQADLIAYVFEGPIQQQAAANRLARELFEWMEASARFTAFVDTYRDKIRKKVRVTRDAESMLDLRSELEVACRLLNDRRLAVTYEPYASARQRGPDFAVTYRANLVFNIEVARLRVEEAGSSAPPPHAQGAAPMPDAEPVRQAEHKESSRKEDKIVRVLLNKLGQMQPNMGNLLTIHTSADLVHSIDLPRLMQGLKARVEGKDPAFFAASRYTGPAEFYKDFSRLSGILLWNASGQLWVNKQSRPVLAENVLRVAALALSNPSSVANL